MTSTSPPSNSAGSEAQKRKRVAARLREEADRLDREADRWGQGADGEEQTRQAIDSIPDVFAIHDCRIPRSKANLDHLLIANRHLSLIDSKHWPGTYTRSQKGWLYRNGDSCYKQLQKVFWQQKVLRDGLVGTCIAEVEAQLVICLIGAEWRITEPWFQEKRGWWIVPLQNLRRFLEQGETVESRIRVDVSDAADVLLRRFPPKPLPDGSEDEGMERLLDRVEMMRRRTALDANPPLPSAVKPDPVRSTKPASQRRTPPPPKPEHATTPRRSTGVHPDGPQAREPARLRDDEPFNPPTTITPRPAAGNRPADVHPDGPNAWEPAHRVHSEPFGPIPMPPTSGSVTPSADYDPLLPVEFYTLPANTGTPKPAAPQPATRKQFTENDITALIIFAIIGAIGILLLFA